MTFLNRVILTGRVATSPRRHYRPDGSPVVQFPLELNDESETSGPALNRNGRRQCRRSRIDIVAIGKLAELEANLLESGRHVVVTGRLNQRCWQTPEGKKRTQTEVIATSLQPIEENPLTQKSTLKRLGLEVDDCPELASRGGNPDPQRKGLQAPKGSRKEGE